jgi:hypothetical protein
MVMQRLFITGRLPRRDSRAIVEAVSVLFRLAAGKLQKLLDFESTVSLRKDAECWDSSAEVECWDSSEGSPRDSSLERRM